MIVARNLAPPPPWALLQRQLISFMEEAALYAAAKYNHPDGTPLNVQDADDAYEAHSYRGCEMRRFAHAPSCALPF